MGAETKIRISKFLFIDIGLLLAAQGIPAQSLMHSPLELANRGLLAEQFVGQQLLYAKPAYVNPELYYWQPPRSETQAEVDYLYLYQNEIIPVEVKSGSTGSMNVHPWPLIVARSMLITLPKSDRFYHRKVTQSKRQQSLRNYLLDERLQYLMLRMEPYFSEHQSG